MVNKILAVWFLMVWVCFGQTQGMSSPLENDIEQEMYVIGKYPKVGDIFEVVYRIKLKEVNELHRIPKKMIEMGYSVVFHTSPSDSVMIISDREIFVPALNVGEWREFHAKLKVTGRTQVIRVAAVTRFKVSRYFSGASINTPIYLLDPQTGQYGTREEYEGKLPVEYRYDPLVGTFTCSPRQNPAPVEENKAIIKMIKQLEPALSDSEALLLHSEQYKVGVPKGVSKWDESSQRWTEEKIFEYYLEDGWLNALKEGKLDDWRLKEKKKIESEWKEDGSFNFFRDRDDTHGSGAIDSRVTKVFMGSGATKTITTTKTTDS